MNSLLCFINCTQGDYFILCKAKLKHLSEMLVEFCPSLDLVTYRHYSTTLWSYITPAHIQHWACVHLLSFRDGLTIILNLPTSHLRFNEKQMQIKMQTHFPTAIKFSWIQRLTSLAHEPPIRKFPGIVGGLKAKQLMLSSGGDVTSTSYHQRYNYYQYH